MQGRIGDSPLIGCGGYANEYGGCSTTGHGESMMKITLAREVIFNIEKGKSAQVNKLKCCLYNVRKVFFFVFRPC